MDVLNILSDTDASAALTIARPECYGSFISDLLQSAFSVDQRRLNQLVDDARFEEVLFNWLGYEVANFYFYDPRLDTLQFFHKAVDGGINPPWFRIDGLDSNGGKFKGNQRAKEEKNRLREKQRTHSDSADAPTTARLCLRNLLPGGDRISRRSKTEESENWVLVPRGERAIFCFEWHLIAMLQEVGCQDFNRAISKVVTDDFIADCWTGIYDSDEYEHMRGEGERDYREGIEWLRKVMRDRSEYEYLWSESDDSNWFVKHCPELTYLLTSATTERIDYHVLREIALLMLLGSGANGTIVNLESVGFYRRCRFSPHFELLLGSHNIVTFLLSVPIESKLVEAPTHFYAFLLGTFYESEICKRNSAELKSIFYLLAVRDIIRFSNVQLHLAQESIRRTNAIMANINDAYFLHEIRSPLANLNLYLRKLEAELKRGGASTVAMEKCGQLQVQRERLKRAMDVLLSISSSLSGEFHLVDLSATVYRLADRLVRELHVPDAVEIIKRFPDRQFPVQLDEDVLHLIMANLMSNAIDAMGNEGTITLTICAMGNLVSLEIADNGPGISCDVLPRLFEKGISTKKASNRGLGLGLYITKHLMDLLRGGIKAQNTDEGASFTLTFEQYEKGS